MCLPHHHHHEKNVPNASGSKKFDQANLTDVQTPLLSQTFNPNESFNSAIPTLISQLAFTTSYVFLDKNIGSTTSLPPKFSKESKKSSPDSKVVLFKLIFLFSIRNFVLIIN
jgi:hypothetical protein